MKGRELEGTAKELARAKDRLNQITYRVLFKMYVAIQHQFFTAAEVDLSFLGDPAKIEEALAYCRNGWGKEMTKDKASPSSFYDTSLRQNDENELSKGTEVSSTS